MHMGKIEAAEEIRVLSGEPAADEAGGRASLLVGLLFLLVAVPYWVVRLVGSVLWRDVRGHVARILGRGDDGAEAAMADELEESRCALLAAESGEGRREAEAALRVLLRYHLRQHPELADPLAVVFDQIGTHTSQVNMSTTVEQRADVGPGGVAIQAGRDARIGRLPWRR